MIKLIHKLPQNTVQDVVKHLEENIKPNSYINNKPGTYAPGRREAWLNIHTPLTKYDNNGNFQPGMQDKRLWDWCLKVASKDNFTPNTGLAVNGEKGIKFHRDASTLTPQGVTINLGGTNFIYADDRQAKTHTVYTLNPGDVISFNSKFEHAVPEPQPGRWAIILWRVQDNKAWIKESFWKFKEHYAHLI